MSDTENEIQDLILRLNILQVQLEYDENENNKNFQSQQDNWVYVSIRQLSDLGVCPNQCNGNGTCQNGQCQCNFKQEETFLGKYCEQHSYRVGTFKEISSTMGAFSTRFITINIEDDREFDQNLLIKFSKFTDNSSLLASSYLDQVDNDNDDRQFPGFIDTNNSKVLSTQSTSNKLPYYQITTNQLDKIKKLESRSIILGLYNMRSDPVIFTAQILFSNEHAYDDGLPIEAKIIIYVFIGIVIIILVAITYTFCQKSDDSKIKEQAQIQAAPDSVQQRQLSGVQSARQGQVQSSLQQANQMQGPNQLSKSKKKKMLKLTKEIIDEFFPEQLIEEIKKEMQNDYPELNHEMTECSVCLMEFEEDEMCRMTLCLHVFHSECLVSWLKKNENCPVCRYVLNRKALLEYMQEEEQRQSTVDLQTNPSKIKNQNQDMQSLTYIGKQDSNSSRNISKRPNSNKIDSVNNMEEEQKETDKTYEICSQLDIEKIDKSQNYIPSANKIDNLQSETSKQLDNQLNTEVNQYQSRDTSPQKKKQFINNLNMSNQRNRNVNAYDLEEKSPSHIYGNGRLFQNNLNTSLNNSYNQNFQTGMSNDKFIDNTMNQNNTLTTNPDMCLSDQKMMSSQKFNSQKKNRKQTYQIQTGGGSQKNINLDILPSPLINSNSKYLNPNFQSIREEGASLNHSFNGNKNKNIVDKQNLDSNGQEQQSITQRFSNKKNSDMEQSNPQPNILSGFSNFGGNQELDNLNKDKGSFEKIEEKNKKKDFEFKKKALQQKRQKLAKQYTKEKSNN